MPSSRFPDEEGFYDHPRRRSRDDLSSEEEDEDAPLTASDSDSGGGKGGSGWMFCVAIGVILLLAGVGGAWYFLSRKPSASPTSSSSSSLPSSPIPLVSASAAPASADESGPSTASSSALATLSDSDSAMSNTPAIPSSTGTINSDPVSSKLDISSSSNLPTSTKPTPKAPSATSASSSSSPTSGAGGVVASIAAANSMTPASIPSLPMPTATLTNSATTTYIESAWKVISGSSKFIQFEADPIEGSGVVLSVEYPKGSYAGSTSVGIAGVSGMHLGVFGEDTPQRAMVAYDVAFDKGFDFANGGKLPGLYGGDPQGGCAGGKHSDICFSLRLMWRTKGQGEVYAYIAQYPEFCKNVSDCNDSYGISIGRGSWDFQAGAWTSIIEVATLNAPASPTGPANGLLSVYANGKLVLSQDNVVFRTNPSVKGFTSLFFSTFFGGSSTPSFQSTMDCKSYFRNIQFFSGKDPSTASGTHVQASMPARKSRHQNTNTAPTGKEGGTLGSLFSRLTEQVSALPSVNQLQNSLRQQAVVHDPRQLQETLKLQLAIKSAKGVTSDYEALAREEKMFSKNLYVWGKDENGEDLNDMTDRLAFLIYKSAEVQEAHAKRLEQSRQALKDIRNFENDLVPKRAKCTDLSNKLQALKAGKQHKNAPSQIAQMEADLLQMENEDSTFEQSLSVLKRTKLHECFTLQFESQRELGEKMALLAGFGELLIEGMETEGVGIEYKGSERSARIRAMVGQEMDGWNPAQRRISKPDLNLGAGGATMLGRSDTRSFGSTHATELSQIGDVHSGAPSPNVATAGHSPLPTPSAARPVPPPPTTSTTTNPLLPEGAPPINLSPTISPVPTTISPPISPPALPLRNPVESYTPDQDQHQQKEDSNVPHVTIAETGEPVQGGGEKSGQLRRASMSQDQKTISLASLGSNDGSVLPVAGSSNAGVNRMNTVNRRRMEESEQMLGGGVGAGAESDVLPAYADGFGEADEANRRAEEILAREREMKRSGLGQ